MSDILQTNEVFYRSCILYEALHKKPVEEAYRNMKEVMPTLNFLDFQYWYFRFLNGNLDLNHDRSKDPKTLLLDDMPVDVVERIVEKLDFIDQMSTRNASKSLRCVVDKIKSSCESVNLSLSQDSSEIRGSNAFHRIYKTPNHLQLVMKDFAAVIKSPNSKFESACYLFPAVLIPNYDAADFQEFNKSIISSYSTFLGSSYMHLGQMRIRFRPPHYFKYRSMSS